MKLRLYLAKTLGAGSIEPIDANEPDNDIFRIPLPVTAAGSDYRNYHVRHSLRVFGSNTAFAP
jgi:hypothetical protein